MLGTVSTGVAVAFVAAHAVMGASMVLGVANIPNTMPSAHAEPAIQEDDPRWDCQTMGNRICGEVKAVESDHPLCYLDPRALCGVPTSELPRTWQEMLMLGH